MSLDDVLVLAFTMSVDLAPSMSSLSNHYEHQESAQSLLSRRGSGLYSSSRYLQVDDTGVYLTSLAVTILISAITTIGILLFTLVITLAILLASCQSKPDVVVKQQGIKTKGGVDVCRSFFLNFELNNLQEYNAFPGFCEDYIFQYMTGGQYENDVKEAIGAAEYNLLSVATEGDGLDAVIMDIDETALSNLPYYSAFQSRSKLQNVDAWNHWVAEGKAPALIPTLELYQKLQTHGLALIFLTGRYENQRNSTVQNLLRAGYPGWTMLIMRSEDELEMNTQAYKSKHRLHLESQGFHIKGIIGDQWSDISGPAVGNHAFKIPNPLYYIS